MKRMKLICKRTFTNKHSYWLEAVVGVHYNWHIKTIRYQKAPKGISSWYNWISVFHLLWNFLRTSHFLFTENLFTKNIHNSFTIRYKEVNYKICRGIYFISISLKYITNSHNKFQLKLFYTYIWGALLFPKSIVDNRMRWLPQIFVFCIILWILRCNRKICHVVYKSNIKE